MKKKILSLLACTALILGSVQPIASAEETVQKTSAKLGIENGDTVTFAGTNNTPVKWRVVDNDKSNTGNSNGILLLSKDTLINVESPEKTAAWTVDACSSFYSNNFKALEQSAVMTVSKTDDAYGFGGFSFKGSLPSGTAVFALSAPELNSLSAGLKEFNGSENWFLRSVSDGTPFMYSYADNAGNFTLKSSAIEPRKNLKIRPAVNLKKSTLASLDEKPLLLPAGNFSAADNKLASLSAASEWKLTQKNADVTITQTSTDIKSDKDFTLTVGTSLENANGDDYISLIVKKGNGSISHYGRYAMTTSEKSVDFTLPDGFDQASDSVYVFYENYNGAMSGSASDLKKVCLKHEYSSTSLDAASHRISCKNCAYYYDENHNNEKSAKDDTYHTIKCSTCGYSEDKKHTFKVFETTDEQHTMECTVCAYQSTGEHTYSGTVGSTETAFDCSVCEKSAPFTAIENDFGEDIAAVRDEYKKGSAKIYQDNGKYIGDPENGIFSDENSAEIVSDGVVRLTFNTNKAIRATGFKIITVENKDYIPEKITLYGRKNSLTDYQKIGTAVIKSILPTLSEGESYSGKAYSFLFTDTSKATAYNDYMLEMYKDDLNGSNTRIQLKYFGLISGKKTNFSYSLDGAVIDGEPLSTVYPGEDLTFTVRSKNGHPKKEEITVYADGTKLDYAAWSYSEENGVFILPGEYISGNRTYLLEIKCTNKTLSVEHELSNLTLSEGNKTAEFGKDYICVFADSNGNTTYVPTSLTNGDIKVYCGDTDITEQCVASSLGEGKLIIPGKYVLDNIKIVAREKYSVENESSQIKIERTGKTTHWYDNVDDAKADIKLELGGDLTVTLLKDIYIPLQSEGFVFGNGNATFDFNGHTIKTGRYITAIYAESNAHVTLKNGSIIVDNNSYPACNVSEKATLCINNVSIYKKDDYGSYGYIEVYGELIVNSDTDKPISEIWVWQNGSLKLKNGMIHQLQVFHGGICKLYSGTVAQTYKLDDNFNITELNYNELLGEGCEFYNITSQADFDAGKPTGFSVKCSHVNTDNDSGECMGCGRKLFIKTVNGEKVNWYDDIYDAAAYANENANTTIRLLGDLESADDSKGWLSFTGSNTTLDLNGKSFTTSNIIAVTVTGTLTITGNGTIHTTINAQDYDDNHPLLTIENGTFYSVNGKLLLKGGTFTRIYSQNPNDMLAEGKTLQNRDGNFVQMDDSPIINNVTVTDVPFKITKQPEGKLITDTSADETISVEANALSEYENDITYMWYERTAQYDTDWEKWRYTETALENETSQQLQLPKNLPAGTQKTYRCKVSCKGYFVYTDYVMYTFGSKTPFLEYDSDNCIAWVNGYGVDCVLVVESYRENKLLNRVTQRVSAKDGLSKINIYEYITGGGTDTVKIYLLDAAEKNQVSETITTLRDNIMIFCTDGIEYIVGSEDVECVCIIASYKDGRLVDLVHIDLNESNEYYGEVTFNAENSTEVKVFVLKDLQSLTPLRFHIDYV